MSPKKVSTKWAPIPFRAVADPELTGIPLKVLIAIAGHDQFGHNGQGCWASHERIAELIGCFRPTVSEAIGLLEMRGYLDTAVNPKDRRMRIYRVVYRAEDSAAFKARKQRTLAEFGSLLPTDGAGVSSAEFQNGSLETTKAGAQSQAQVQAIAQSFHLQEQPEYISQKEKNNIRAGSRSQGPWGCGAKVQGFSMEGSDRTNGLVRALVTEIEKKKYRPKIPGDEE